MRGLTPHSHYATVISDLPQPRYSIRQARITDLKSIADLQQLFYADDAVPADLYREWFEVNPKGFYVLESNTTSNQGIEQNELVGHITFLAIRDDCLKLYREGVIRETDIRHYNLLGPDEPIKTLYLESVIVEKTHRRHAMRTLTGKLKTMVCKFCNPEVAECVYAMAATKDGEKFLRRMGFAQVMRKQGTKRRDGHEMFECEMTQFLKTLSDLEAQYEINRLPCES